MQVSHVEVDRWTKLGKLRSSKLRPDEAKRGAGEIVQRANIQGAEIRMKTTKAVLDRLRQMLGQGVGSASEVQNATAAYEEARKALEDARARD